MSAIITLVPEEKVKIIRSPDRQYHSIIFTRRIKQLVYLMKSKKDRATKSNRDADAISMK